MGGLYVHRKSTDPEFGREGEEEDDGEKKIWLAVDNLIVFP